LQRKANSAGNAQQPEEADVDLAEDELGDAAGVGSPHAQTFAYPAEGLGGDFFSGGGEPARDRGEVDAVERAERLEAQTFGVVKAEESPLPITELRQRFAKSLREGGPVALPEVGELGTNVHVERCVKLRFRGRPALGSPLEVESDAQGGDADPAAEGSAAGILRQSRGSAGSDQKLLPEGLADLVHEGGRAIDGGDEGAHRVEEVLVEETERDGVVLEAATGQVEIIGGERGEGVGERLVSGDASCEVEAEAGVVEDEVRPPGVGAVEQLEEQRSELGEVGRGLCSILTEEDGRQNSAGVHQASIGEAPGGVGSGGVGKWARRGRRRRLSWSEQALALPLSP
jgi:hypothetical protein